MVNGGFLRCVSGRVLRDKILQIILNVLTLFSRKSWTASETAEGTGI
jgi:hypothetical protein